MQNMRALPLILKELKTGRELLKHKNYFKKLPKFVLKFILLF
jgi:hypothetical protein